MTRSTTNSNDAGGPSTRLKRKQWLVEEFRADRDLLECREGPAGRWALEVEVGLPRELVMKLALPEERPNCVIWSACRCYRCGKLLTVATVTVDRRIPGCLGGTYHHNNIRPACARCNSSTGGKLGKLRAMANRGTK